ncbi:hypothetical protein CGRA01v4_02900 [Colletotrichum graminicola]|nr:hypothetical protein CGRA01v4_02900 [Colletotrichum graminicola]
MPAAALASMIGWQPKAPQSPHSNPTTQTWSNASGSSGKRILRCIDAVVARFFVRSSSSLLICLDEPWSL